MKYFLIACFAAVTLLGMSGCTTASENTGPTMAPVGDERGPTPASAPIVTDPHDSSF